MPSLRRLLIVVAAALAVGGCGDEEDGDETAAPAGDAEPVQTEPAETGAADTPAQTTPTQTEPAGTVPTATTPQTAACGDVGFEPQTDAGAFGIRATGVGCEVARRVAAASEGVRELRYTSAGFTCTGERREDGLTRVEWTCTRDGAEITFTSS